MVPITKTPERDAALADYQKANRTFANLTLAERVCFAAQRFDIDSAILPRCAVRLKILRRICSMR